MNPIFYLSCFYERVFIHKSIKSLFSLCRGISAFVFLLILGLTLPLPGRGQTSPNEAQWNGLGYSLKKITSNTTIPSGVNFSYTILFSAPAGATSINITDAIPSSVEVVTVPPPAMVNGVTPVVSTTGVWPSPQTVSYSLTGLPSGMASSGSFTIVVKFPEGTTCNGAVARNRAAILIDDKPNYTPYLSTSATAVDPWKVQKTIISGAGVNPMGGSCGYLMEPGDTVTYRLSVLKNSPYYGNVVGQQNMSSAVVTDVLPPGAVLVSKCGVPTNVTGTFTWQPNSGNLNAATNYAFYYCDIKVYYPAASFPISTIINNQVNLDGIICGQQVSHTSNQTCIEVANIAPNPSAYFQKYISLTNRVPGCTGIYTIVFCNNGNVPLTAFNIDDAIPSGVSVDQVAVYGANATTSINVTANSGANTIASGLAGYLSPVTIGYSVNDLQLQMTSSLPVGACIYLYVYFTVEPNPTGTIVTNCASFNGLSNGLTLPQACVSFTVDAGAPHPCLIKDVCSPQASYDPGDIVRFRLRIQNIGSADITGASFQDNLNSNFTYVGNESYYIANTYNPACSSAGGIPAGTTAWLGVTASQSGNNLNWSLPDIPSDCQLFYVAYCGYYGTYGLPYYFVEFDVMVDSMAMPGVTPNNYDISGGNLTGTVTSNTTNTLIVASFGQEVTKQVSTDNGTTFASSGTVAPGDSARYRLNYKNTSNVSVSSVNLVDLLPMDDGANDWLVLNRSVARGSQFSVGYNNNHNTSVTSGTAPTPSLSYTAGTNICLPPFGITPGVCNPVTWSGTADQNIKIDYGNTYLLGSNVTVREDFDVTIPSSATNQQTACNDFAAISTANFLINGTTPQSIALTPIAAPPVCLTIDTSIVSSSSCCDSVRIEQTSDAAGNGCCVRIVTDCEVKAISVSATNGTISSAGWNCGTLPTGYAGQSSFTFPANNCVVDMTTCFKPTQPGTVTVTITIYFQNGVECVKTVDLNCGVSHTECCDSTTLELVQNSDLQDACCARLVTNCEVDSVLVNISNGTFASATWNCGTVPTGYEGLSSYTFDANLCAVDLVTCIDADQTGVVVANYTVYFANGDSCVKVIDMDCKADVNCCDSIEVRAVQDATNPNACCAEIISKCNVDSISVSVLNGTLSSASWNCGSIPVGYVGKSSYTFNANNCPADLVTCVNAKQTGVVTINYVVYLANGEKCQKSFKLDCKASTCCDKTRLEKVINPDGTTDCCVKLTTECEVKSIQVDVTNGTISSAAWSCGTITSGYSGQSNYTFNANGCVVAMTNCFNATQSGVVSVTYSINYSNGETCKKTIELDCKYESSSCCALVDFKLKQKWPHFSTQIGTFNITNLDPSSPICSVIINASPAATFTTGGLIIDGVPSTQIWNSSSIPASGSLSPTAINSMVFSLIGSNYHGTITVCVVKCDGTECCFEFKWNKKIIIDVDINTGQLPHTGKLVSVTINPVVTTSTNDMVKYVSFGMSDEQEVAEFKSEFFAISAAEFQGDEYPDKLAAPVTAYMGKNNAFFELSQPKRSGENLGAFNLVFSKMLPKLGCTLFDEEGNIIFSGNMDVTLADTVNTSAINAAAYSEDMFEFIKLYPNPSDGRFKITYATGSERDIEIRVVNPMGQVVKIIDRNNETPGIHTVDVPASDAAAGLYKIVLYSEGEMLSKSAILNK